MAREVKSREMFVLVSFEYFFKVRELVPKELYAKRNAFSSRER